jgi:nicotinate-nucleotide adenylyltransferase
MESPQPRRVGIFGGTFDPVHLGHLILAEQCREQAPLDEVWFVPAARPPHKATTPLTSFLQRAEMLALALAGQAAFQIDSTEKERPGPSFTVDTLDELRQRHPGTEFFLLLGSDSLVELPHWREPRRIVEHTTLLVATRPGWPLPSAEQFRAALHLPEEAPLPLQFVEAPLIDISSRDLRRRAAEGRSLRYLVPRAVECYIQEKRLYQP